MENKDTLDWCGYWRSLFGGDNLAHFGVAFGARAFQEWATVLHGRLLWIFHGLLGFALDAIGGDSSSTGAWHYLMGRGGDLIFKKIKIRAACTGDFRFVGLNLYVMLQDL